MSINTNGEMRKMKHNWHLVDWDQPTSVIAQQLGTSEVYVSGRRRKYAPETVRQNHTKRVAMMDRCEEIDWSKSDIQIAKETNRSRAGVWNTRRLISLKNHLIKSR